MKKKIEIKNRTTCEVIFAHEEEDNSILKTVEAAVKAKVKLHFADLRGANLKGAKLGWAEMAHADLSNALLCFADLSSASLDCANLYKANLRGAELRCTHLMHADLRGADFSHQANLFCADMFGANLDGERLIRTPLLLELRWSVLITVQYMKIGCRRYSHGEWAKFSDDEIGKMHPEALEHWRVWKKPLLAMCEAHAAG